MSGRKENKALGNSNISKSKGAVANPLSRIENLKDQLNPEALKTNHVNNQLMWGGFYKKSFQERLDQIKKIDPDIAVENFETGGLSLSRAELMVENCIGKLSLPMGLGLNFLVNNTYYTIPMVVEEPSVIAAASSSAKFIADNGGGFHTYSTQPIMIGQIHIMNVDSNEAIFKIERSKAEIIAKGNEVCQKLVGRGGGVVDIRTKVLKNNTIDHVNFRGDNDMLVVELLINVCEIMGANVINTILEHVAPNIASITGGRLGIRILSNLCTERRTFAHFSIPVKAMGWKQASGEQVAQGILEAYRFAQLDPFRAATHNKGIMNGVDAVALATGQDWRAIEAAAHAFSFHKHGRYQPLSHYEIKTLNNGEKVFKGSLEIPLSVGSKGGVLESNPLYKNSFRLMMNPDSKTLSELIVCVGLAQNFAALRALVIEGIQKGHMALHARNIALSAGVPTYLVDEAARYMKLRGNISLESARLFIEAHDLFSTLRTSKESEEKLIQKPLSTFLVEIRPTSMDEPIQLHVAFDCWTTTPIHLSIEKNKPKSIAQSKESMQIQQLLFGSKEYDWLDQIFQLLEIIRVDYKKNNENMVIVEPKKVNRNVHIYKLKLTAIMVSLLSMSLVKKNKEKISFIFQNSQQESHTQKLFDTQEILLGEPEDMKYGLSLLCELIRLFKFHVNQSVENHLLKQSLLNELYHVIESNIFAWDNWNLTKSNIFNFEKFLILRKKRLSASLILLCDLIDSQVNESDIQMIKNLGDIFEIQATVARDLNRWNSIIDCNIYSYWLIERNLVHRGTEKSVQNDFVHSVSRDFLETKKKQLMKGNKELLNKHIGSEFLLKIISNTGNVIEEYYKFKDSELMAKPGL